MLPSPGLRSQPSAAGLGPGVALINKLRGLVTILRTSGRLPAKIGDALFQKDVAETGAVGRIGMTFIDDTYSRPARTARSRSTNIT
jgi:hypothetical protein